VVLLDGNRKFNFQTNRVITCYQKNESEKFVSNGERMELPFLKQFQINLTKKFKEINGLTLEIVKLKYIISKTPNDFALTFQKLEGEEYSQEKNIGYFYHSKDLVYLIFRDVIGRSNKELDKKDFIEQITKIYKYIIAKSVVE
jgi:hypothetical protein